METYPEPSTVTRVLFPLIQVCKVTGSPQSRCTYLRVFSASPRSRFRPSSQCSNNSVKFPALQRRAGVRKA